MFFDIEVQVAFIALLALLFVIAATAALTAKTGDRPFRIAIGCSVAIALLGVIVSFLSHNHRGLNLVHRDAIGSVGEWVAGVGAIAAVYYLAAQLKRDRNNHNDQIEELQRKLLADTKRATLEYWVQTLEQRNKLRSGVLPHERNQEECDKFSRDFLEVLTKDGERSDEVQKVEEAIVSYLSLIETLGVGISVGAFDLETIYLLDGPRLIGVRKLYKGWIESRRPHPSSPIYVGIHTLANELQKHHGQVVAGVH